MNTNEIGVYLQGAMDYAHYVRTWAIPQYLRRRGWLSEGYNPDKDRYEHAFMGVVYQHRDFIANEALASAMTKTIEDDKAIRPFNWPGARASSVPFIPSHEKDPKKLRFNWKLTWDGKDEYFHETIKLARRLAECRTALVTRTPSGYSPYPEEFAGSRGCALIQRLPSGGILTRMPTGLNAPLGLH